MTDDADPPRGLPAENRRPWYEAYAERPWRVVLAGIVAGTALLFVGVALGRGNREHVIPVGTLVAAIIGGGIALGQLQVARKRHEEQTKADLQRRITESFTKAVEQLGSQHLPVRVGGIYALERISRESDEDYWIVMETLTAFVREQARWKKPDPANVTSAEERHEVPTDVAAVIAVVGRRRQQNLDQEQREGWQLDLRSTDLRGANLEKMHFERAILAEAHLEGAYLVEAHLEGTILTRAHLEGANLSEAHLEGANLWGTYLEGTILMKAHLKGALLLEAHLKGAFLTEAHLEGASLSGAHLERADLKMAHLEGTDLLESNGLTQGQLDEAFGDVKTQLPKCVKRPGHWE